MRTARSGSSTGLVTAGLTAATILVAPARPAPAQEPPDSAVANPALVRGEVVDVESEQPVPAARISLTALGDSGASHPIVADSAGTFHFGSIEAGGYRIRITRLGYRAIDDTVLIARDGETWVRVSMVPQAMDLEPLVVTAVRRTPPFMRDFERRRKMGIGRFITREEIEDESPFVTSDLFRTVPGVRVVPGGATGGPGLVMRGRCRPQLYIDGIPAWREVSIDLALRPHDIEAIEVYSAGGTPVRYSRNACGVILVWTRAPQAVEGDGSFWKRLAVVGGLFLGGMILSR